MDPLAGYVRAPRARGRLRLGPRPRRYLVSVAVAFGPALRPVRSGRSYRVTSRSAGALVVPALAEALETVFERFARTVGATGAQPLRVHIARGFVPSSPGHGQGRAADIAAVGGRCLLDWKRDWDRAAAVADRLPDPEQQAQLHHAEGQRNLGYGLYRALLGHGGWRVDELGWRPYRGVVQLFGPWTGTEGPWKTMDVRELSQLEQRHLADQRWVLAAHQDHIHVAR